jgi:hypothetical protein
VHVSQAERDKVFGGRGEPRLSEHAIDRDIDFLTGAKPWKSWRYQLIIDQIARREGDAGGEHFLQVLKRLRVILPGKSGRNRLHQIGRAMTTVLSGVQLRKFVEEVIKQGAISDDFMHTATTLNQHGVDPHIILDFMAQPSTPKKTLMEFVNMLPRDQVIQVIDFAAGMVGDSDREKMAKLRSLESFPDNYMQHVDSSGKWSDKKIQGFVENVCGFLKAPIPGNVKVFGMRNFLDVNVKFFLQSAMEADEFSAVLDRECDGDAILLRDAIEYLATRCSSLALYVAYVHRQQQPEVDASTAFTPVCTPNRELHMLSAICKEPIIVRESNNMKDLAVSLRMTLFIAIAGTKPHGQQHFKAMDMIVIRTCDKVFVVFPKLFPDLVERVGGILCREALDKKVFVYKGQQLMDFLGEEFGWRPVSVVDAMDICGDRKWAQNLSTLTERTVGGEFCRRASHFSATAIPSTIVLKHRAMTVSLIYCFGLKYGRSQRQSIDPKAKVGGSQRSESATEPTARDRSPLRSCPRRSNDGGGS